MDLSQVVLACKRDIVFLLAYPVAPILLITDSPALVLLTFSSSLLLLASMAGITGTLLNSRPILAVYVLLLFPSFLSFVSVGYLTYKKRTFLSMQRSAKRGTAGTLPALGLYYKELSAVVVGAVHFTVLQHQAHVTPVLLFPAATAHSCVSNATFFPRSQHSILSRAAPFDEYFGRSPLRQPRNAPFRKGYHTRALRLTAQDILLSSAGSAAAASSSAVDKRGVMKQTDLPVPPFPAPKGHSTFREDRESVTTYRHHAREFEREV
ncbi:hypothetical protein BGY98DRAFT_1104499 [Russula aff. rugulosa BPL654]|nr:hypothetical protein BGY98DRAFT_1104499 [Russula aff. rugulosa BPL654]